MGILSQKEGAAPNAVDGVCVGGVELPFDGSECLFLRVVGLYRAGSGLLLAVVAITSQSAAWPGAEVDRTVEGDGGGLSNSAVDVSHGRTVTPLKLFSRRSI